MRKRDFALPNLVATVRFVGAADDVKMVLHGPDKVRLEARMKTRYPGIQIKDVTPYDFATEWGKKANDRTLKVQAAINAKEKYDFNKNSIWGELKDFLFDLFDGNCAYCECDLLSGSFGAVEHYRPKNPVPGVAGHPGYYWLAYAPTNYLPTCTRCNTAKSNFFPLADGSPRAIAEGDEKTEHALLLNPYLLDVAITAHLVFTADGTDKVGPVAKGVSPEGKASVERLDLNRADLLTARLHEQEQAASDYFLQRKAGMQPPPVVEQLKTGKRPFSAAALAAVSFMEQGFPSLGS